MDLVEFIGCLEPFLVVFDFVAQFARESFDSAPFFDPRNQSVLGDELRSLFKKETNWPEKNINDQQGNLEERPLDFHGSGLVEILFVLFGRSSEEF